MKKKNWRSFKEARKFVQKLKLKGWKEWLNYCKSGKKPNNIPSNPQNVYKKNKIINGIKKNFLLIKSNTYAGHSRGYY